jgi:hypothetical protein
VSALISCLQKKSYKKLMGRSTGLEDLAQVSPELYRGMNTLLSFDGNVQEVYDRNFQVEVDNFGQKVLFVFFCFLVVLIFFFQKE